MDTTASIDELLRLGTRQLSFISKYAKSEATTLLSYSLKKDKLFVMSNGDYVVKDPSYFFSLLERRMEFEPIEYITSSVSFYEDYFYVEKGALIPRPETELIIEQLVGIIDISSSYTIAEIGVGSGSLIVSMAKILKKCKFIGSDISSDALKVARRNIKDFALEDRIELHLTNLLDSIKKKIDIIVSNPPYIDTNYVLPKPLEYEPREALFASNNGLAIIFNIIDLFFSKKCKLLICEIGYNQRRDIEQYLASKFSEYIVSFYHDYSEYDRGFILKRDEKFKL